MQVLTNQVHVGQNVQNATSISGIEYTFPLPIYKSSYDTLSELLTVRLRGQSPGGKWLASDGYIVQYDLLAQKILWRKWIDYSISSYYQYPNLIIISKGKTNYFLDIHSGQTSWEIKNDIYYIDPVRNVGLGYPYETIKMHNKELHGIDLTSGNMLWKRTLDRKYGWNDVYKKMDSTLFVVSGGLHSININSGKGWDYDAETGQKDYKESAIISAAGITLGVLTGVYVIGVGYNWVYDLVSNVVKEDSSIYFSSKERIVKLSEKTGEIIWQHTYLPKMPSKSYIFTHQDQIIVINFGYAFMNNYPIVYGIPFIASYSKESGKQTYIATIISKKDPILQYKIFGDELWLMFKYRLAKYNLTTGALLADITYPKETIGKPQYFCGSQVFVKRNGIYRSLTSLDTTQVYIMTEEAKILAFDSQLNITSKTNAQDLYLLHSKYGDYKFIIKNDKTLLIDKKGELIAELTTSKSALLAGKTLYVLKPSSLISIDLSDLLVD